MANAECVIFAFAAFRKTTQAIVFSISRKFFSSAGKNFMAISLVAYVPYQLVIGGIKNIMQCYSQFNHAKTGAKMAPINTNYINNILAKFIANLVQLFPA